MADSLLDVRDLRTYIFTRRGVVKAVDGASFSLRRGETLGIVGESGSGKTMTCLSIMRLVRASRIAMIFQDPMASLNPAFSVGEQVAEPLRVHIGMRGRSLRERLV